MKTLRISVSALIAVLALGACAQNDADAPSTTTQPPGASVTTDPPTGPAVPTPGAPSSGPPHTPGTPPTKGITTLTGTITSGVEPGCLLIDGYLLVGGPRDALRAGARVTVTGRVQADLMTTCQQGTPFVVQDARPA